MIDSMLYVKASRVDVMQVIGQFARFQVAPKETHIMAIKMIFMYLKGTMDFGLWYPKGNELTLIYDSDVELGRMC